VKPNILLFVIDSLRSDKIFGEQKTTNTPIIDAMIKNGIYFTNAFTTNQYTSQVMQSIFTNRFLLDDEITKNYSNKNNQNSFLSLLKKNGYHTYTLNQEDVFFQGFNEKFDDKDNSFKSEDNLYNGLEEKILNKFTTMNEPWFFYLHLQDLHTPCVVPDELVHLTLRERYDQNLSKIDLLLEKILKLIDIDNTLIILTADHGEYISSTDGPLNESKSTKKTVKDSVKSVVPLKILEKIHIKKQKINRSISAKKTNIPHEKRMLSFKRQKLNQTLFDDIVHVPLLFHGYRINHVIPITQQICNIDIFPTIFDHLKFSNPIKNGHGRSLIPLIKNLEFLSIPIYMTSKAILKQLKMNISIENASDSLVGLRTEKYKFFRNHENENKDVHLYDIINDPLEDDNIANERKDIVAEMELILEKFQNQSESSNNKNDMDEDEIDEDEIKRAQESLKKLGYI
tara:strand:+ start:1952 stop:3316 length:1365 start_codon:yes stop_codon:yes gene_type:complete